MWPLLAILGLLATTSQTRPRKVKQRRWEELGDSAVELEHHWGRVYYELNHGTRQSLLEALRKLNLALSRAPHHPHDTSAESFAKFREKYLDPALILKERAIETLAEMKVLKAKTVHELRQKRVEGRRKPMPADAIRIGA